MSERLTLQKCIEIIKSANEFGRYVDQQVTEEKNVIFLFGVTGVGKTTIAALLEGKILNVAKNGKLYLEGYGISHSRDSSTQKPEFHLTADFIIVDFPGFEDTHGTISEIQHSYQIFKLMEKLQSRNKVKILLVTDDAELKYKRGRCIEKTLDRLNQLFPNFLSLQGSKGLVITKCPYNDIQQNDYDAEVLKNFDNNIFLFPAPDRDRQIVQYPSENSDLYYLQQFVKSSNGFIKDLVPSFSFNDNTKLILNDVTQIQIERNSVLLDNLSKHLSEKFKSRVELWTNSKSDFSQISSGLSRIIAYLKTLKDIDINNGRDFASKFRSCYNDPKFESALKALEESYSLTRFIEKIFQRNIISNKFRKSKDAFLSNLISSLEHLEKDLQTKKEFNDAREKERKNARAVSKLTQELKECRNQLKEMQNKNRNKDKEIIYTIQIERLIARQQEIENRMQRQIEILKEQLVKDKWWSQCFPA